MQSTIKNLEMYIEKVHDQQIKDYETLKKLATDAACGTGGLNMGTMMMPDEQKKVSDVEKSKHAQCTYDYITLCQEQKRIDLVVGRLNGVLTELIKVNLKREENSPEVFS